MRYHSFIILYSYISHVPVNLDEVHLCPTAKHDISPRLNHLTGDTIFHPAVRAGNHSFTRRNCEIVHIHVNTRWDFSTWAPPRSAIYMSPRARPFVGKDYISPSNSRGESLVHCAILIYRVWMSTSTININLRPTENCDRFRQDSIVSHGRHITRGCLFCVTMPQRINPFAAIIGMMLPSTLAM